MEPIAPATKAAIEGEQSRCRQAHLKAANDVGNDRAQNIGEERHHEEDQVDEGDHVAVPSHESRHSVIVILVARSNFPASRPAIAARASVII
jgi:hypothetical protein